MAIHFGDIFVLQPHEVSTVLYHVLSSDGEIKIK